MTSGVQKTRAYENEINNRTHDMERETEYLSLPNVL